MSLSLVFFPAFFFFSFFPQKLLTANGKQTFLLLAESRVLAGIFDMLKLHYPERLDAFWFLNAPTIFWALWRVVGPMVRNFSVLIFCFCGWGGGHSHKN